MNTLKVKNPRSGIADYEITPASAGEVAAIATELKKAQGEWAANITLRLDSLSRWADAMVAADMLQLALFFDFERMVSIFGEGQPTLVGRVLLDLLDNPQCTVPKMIARQPGVGPAAEEKNATGYDKLPEAVIPLIEEKEGAAEDGDDQSCPDNIKGKKLPVQLGIDRRQGFV